MDFEDQLVDPALKDIDYLTKNLGTARPCLKSGRGTIRHISAAGRNVTANWDASLDWHKEKTNKRKKKRFSKLRNTIGSFFSCVSKVEDENICTACTQRKQEFPVQKDESAEASLDEKSVLRVYKEFSDRTQALEEPPTRRKFLSETTKNNVLLDFKDLSYHHVDQSPEQRCLDLSEQTFRKLQSADAQKMENVSQARECVNNAKLSRRSVLATRNTAIGKLLQVDSTSELISHSHSKRNHVAGISHFVSEEVQPIFDQFSKLRNSPKIYPSLLGMTRSRHKSLERGGVKLGKDFRYALHRKVNRSWAVRDLEYILMMMHVEEWFSPRFAAEAVRVDTMNECTSLQLQGFQPQELARVGWYFNGRTLLTFCCGMEMPQQPRGQPLDVHRGLSPQCSFACGVQSPTDIERERAEQRQEQLQACGSQADIGYGYQPVDDPYGLHAQEFDAALFDLSFNQNVGVQQETSPDQHWRTDGDGASYSSPILSAQEGRLYMESVVTNTTPADADRRQPVGATSRASEAAARPAELTRDIPPAINSPFLMPGGLAADPQNHGLLSLLRGSIQNPDLINPGMFFDEYQGREGIQRHPRHPQYAFPNLRLLTFEGWPATHQQKPHDLAEAGLFYAGE